ncbi:hypothetical protein [Dongshaea marina]|uniref:hypothetical protein n=1 Tax=Dongshaea marina TaxID=2047966 RepID=UPI000D3E688B|nr:hypothetical protein [Dongshaea marina]
MDHLKPLTTTLAVENPDELDTVWEFFQKHHWIAPGAHHTPVTDAWERCRRQSNPFTWNPPHVASGSTFRSLLNRNRNLLAITQTLIEDTLSLLPNKHCALAVTDETGCTLMMGGTPGLCESLQKLGLQEGAFWSEGQIGSNAISQSIHLSDPVSMYGSEHFNRTLHDYATHAAPVFSLDGRLRG